jgi:hypothetical protein
VCQPPKPGTAKCRGRFRLRFYLLPTESSRRRQFGFEL